MDAFDRRKILVDFGFRISDFEMGIVEGLKFIEWVKGDGIPDRSSLFDAVENYPRDSGWIIPLMKAYHQIRPL